MTSEDGAKKINGRASALIGLHVLLLIYSLSGFFSKNAASQPPLSLQFILLYGGMLAILFGYAIGWQQVIKRLPLTLAFANKAVTVIWGMVWGVLFFGETITLSMIIGAIIVMAGVALFAVADGEDQARMAAEESAKKERAAEVSENAEAGDAR